MEKKVTSHIVKGLIISAIIIALSVIIYVFDLYDSKVLNFISPAIFFACIIISVLLYSNQKNNTIPFGNLFAHGFVTTCVVIAITSLYTFISLKFLFPDMIDKLLLMQRKQMMENPKITEEMIEQSMNIVKKYKPYFVPIIIASNLFWHGFIGLIASLIGAAVSKKKTSPFENKPTI
jgi:hypothetical protein